MNEEQEDFLDMWGMPFVEKFARHVELVLKKEVSDQIQTAFHGTDPNIQKVWVMVSSNGYGPDDPYVVIGFGDDQPIKFGLCELLTEYLQFSDEFDADHAGLVNVINRAVREVTTLKE